MSRRLQLVVTACVAAAVVTGCGGTSSQSGGIGGSGASLVSSGALAYVAVDSDLNSGRWQQVDKLLKKFPLRDRLLSELENGLAGQQIDYERDVKPALGPEVDFAAVGGPSERDISYAVLTKPDSIEKAKALVRKLDASSPPPSATRVVDGWLVVADKQETIDAVLKGSGSSLADDSTFKDAFGQLPDDALVKAYASGQQLSKLAGSLYGAGTKTAMVGGPPSFGKLDWLAASVVAADDGLKLEGDAKSAGGGFREASYASKLISGVPADAFAFATFHGRSGVGQLSRLRQNPAFNQAFRQVEQQLGMRLDEVLALFEHETAFYVRRGPGLPEFSLVFAAPNTAKALATIDRLAAGLARRAHAQVGAEKEGGLDVKTLNFGRVTVRWAGFDGRVLLTTAPTGIADYRASGDKLGDDPTFRDALDAAGAPDKTLGLIYLNLADGLRLAESYLGLSGGKLPPDIRANTKPLRSFVAYGTSSGGSTKLAAFLEIK
jgi:hypothetical protein